ncbi:hypothetical protein ACB092_01G215600 [Castanea dentata]
MIGIYIELYRKVPQISHQQISPLFYFEHVTIYYYYGEHNT